MVSDEEVIQEVKDSDAHEDVVEYIRVATELNKGMGMVSTLRHFAEESNVSDIARIGTALEKEVWNNGVRRLALDPAGEPYGANPDPDTQEVLEEVYSRNY